MKEIFILKLICKAMAIICLLLAGALIYAFCWEEAWFIGMAMTACIIAFALFITMLMVVKDLKPVNL